MSNLPVYLTGDYNTASNVALVNSLPWTSALVAGDELRIYFQQLDRRAQPLINAKPAPIGRPQTPLTKRRSCRSHPIP